MRTQLYFWTPLMEKHKKELSLVREYFDRTKIQFENIEEEAEKHVETIFHSFSSAEEHDPCSSAGWAQEQGIEMFETLLLMKSNHLMMTISLLYHIWEQQLINFTTREMRHYLEFKEALTFRDAKKIFDLHGIDIIETKSWVKIRELKFLVNTIKHGDGDSAEKLRRLRPNFFEMDKIDGKDSLKLHGTVLLNIYALQVEEADLYDYILSVQDFWDEMPERAYADADAIINTL